ncbi:hypothetical protein JCM8097_006191 [Rhodosporidiobolus ruineniae]
MRARSLFRPSVLLAALLSTRSACAQVPAFDLGDIKTIFSLGDSWTTTGYTPSEGVSDINQRATTSGGPTWVQYLAWTHTAAESSYYDLASLGGGISSQVLFTNGAVRLLPLPVKLLELSRTDPPRRASPRSARLEQTDFAGQTAEWLAYFNATTTSGNETSSSVEWESESTLFTIFLGNDDIYNSFENGWNFVGFQPQLLTAFDQQIQRLYNAGARNFLLLSLPSLDLSPLALSISNASSTLATAVDYWNTRLEIYAMFMQRKYAGTRTKWFDARNWTRGILEDPEMDGFGETTTACTAYSSLAYDPEANDSTCKGSLSTYFWKDLYRPTWRVHELLASSIADLLSSETPSLVLPSSAATIFPSANLTSLAQGATASSSAVPVPSGTGRTGGTTTTTVLETATSTVEGGAEETGEGGVRVGTNTSGAVRLVGRGGVGWAVMAVAGGAAAFLLGA